MMLPIGGGMYENPSQDLNFQRCVNLFPSLVDKGGRGSGTSPGLLPTAGLKELVDVGGNEVRALIDFDDSLYAVIDNTFYELTFDQDALTMTAQSRGVINTNTGIVSWARNPLQIMMVDDSSNGYIYTPADTTLTEITDTDFTGGTTVVFTGSFFMYNTPDKSTVFATAINDGTDVSALDVATAEALPDKVVALATDKNELWMLGEKSVEIWYNAANATGFPYSRRGGAFMDIGISAPHSVARINNTLMWLDHRGFIVKAADYNIQTVSNEAITAKIRSYKVIDDAIAFEHEDRGHLFYVLNFPTENVTWSFDVRTEMWHERSYTDESNVSNRHIANVHLRFKNVDFVGAWNSGKIYLLSSDYYDDAGDDIVRLRTTPFFYNEFKPISIDELELHMESGKALVTGNGSDPEVHFRYSHDGGYSWSHSLSRSFGKIGEYDKRIRWNRLGVGTEWIGEFTIREPVKFAISEANLKFNGGDFD